VRTPSTPVRGPGNRTALTVVELAGTPLAPPIGTRDLVPPEAAARRALVRRLASVIELHGYELLTTAPFERADIVDRGLGATDPRDTLRFVDPETSDVSVLRPDLTLQVARVAATGLRDRPAPLRLFYEGHVIRARGGRARRTRQIAQIGAECIGIAGPSGDAEVVSVASNALSAAGLVHRIELAIVPLARALTAQLDPTLRAVVTEALGRKDASSLARALSAARLPKALGRAIGALPSLTGDAAVLDEAVRALRGTGAAPHVARVRALHRELVARSLGGSVRFDLGEVRGFGYYTGPSFSLLAEGPGEPLGGGGRYDDLVGRFGRPTPATGFAIDLDHVAWAMEAQGLARAFQSPPRVCVCGKGRRPEACADALRAVGIRVALLPEHDAAEARAYARAWGLDAAVQPRLDGRCDVWWPEASRPTSCDVRGLRARIEARRAREEHTS
jgi:ATP phosphoribosyltransferase regulatory subunit